MHLCLLTNYQIFYLINYWSEYWLIRYSILSNENLGFAHKHKIMCLFYGFNTMLNFRSINSKHLFTKTLFRVHLFDGVLVLWAKRNLSHRAHKYVLSHEHRPCVVDNTSHSSNLFHIYNMKTFLRLSVLQYVPGIKILM